jgi:hypothetical protein
MCDSSLLVINVYMLIKHAPSVIAGAETTGDMQTAVDDLLVMCINVNLLCVDAHTLVFLCILYSRTQ